MRTADWLTNPVLREMLLPGLLSGIAVVLAASVLSVLVVLKRLAFIGQGVSHSAFGGVGVAAVLGVLASQSGASSGLGLIIVLAFCIAAAIGMAIVSDRRTVGEDTAIGIFLVASMSLGAVLLAISARRGAAGGSFSYESILFGQILSVHLPEAIAAGATAAATLLALWWVRRPLTFWALDESAAAAFGVRGRALRLGLMVLLALAIVTAMKLVGVVLATALLVLPGATALRLCRRLAMVVAISCIVGITGLVGGVVASLELDLPTGATIVLVLSGLFGAASVVAAMRSRNGRAAARNGVMRTPRNAGLAE